ncbi:MAG: tetratricopeptide repeat protein [Pseudomonadota bacterium]
MTNAFMRIAFCAVLAGGLAACQSQEEEVDKTIIGVVDESDLNSIMLTAADPNDAISYFANAVQKDETRIDLQRGLGKSLTRGKRATDAVPVYQKILTMEGTSDQDRIDYADALVRINDWSEAKKQLDLVPPTVQTFQRYRLEALVADANKEWSDADAFYKAATNLTSQPASILNNWGYSKLTRGNFAEAEALFADAVKNDRTLFVAKNNMVLARASQKNYTLPLIPMTETEKAQLYYTLGLSAVKQGNRETGIVLIQQAVDTHPEFFTEAQRSLDSLRGSATN